MTERHYPDVDPNPDFAAVEQAILDFWQEQKLFRLSVESRPARTFDGKNNEFIFYDGPPFANGLPHYGHLLTGFVKDIFARYQTMKGKRVERRFGWDCHGLPAEMGAEKDLHISGRQQIMGYGIDKFNDYCRSSVMKFRSEWEYYVTRQARWVDFQGDYKTMDTSFMESVLWAFKQLWDKGLVYEAHRVMPYSWGAETPLSNFETRLDNAYREREDKAVTVAFKLDKVELEKRIGGLPAGIKDYYILAWTTTPWTLPSNLALAVNKEIKYIIVPKNGVGYILSASAADLKYIKEVGTDVGDGVTSLQSIGSNFDGEKLVGLTYHPLFPYFANHPNAFRILDGSDFVTDEDGTGVVHMAPGFGEDDQRVCEANGIELVCPVDHAGRFMEEIYDLEDTLPSGEKASLSLKGLNVIAENVEKYKFGEANERIIDWLKAHGQLIKQEQILHNYPHCWRTDTPLIYRAMPSWYVEVTKFKDRMVELNQQINWIPGHVKDGLFGKWLENARDWSISRNRFWGTPIPVWRSDNPENKKAYVFGSISELNAFFNVDLKDLHRPYIDELTKPDPENPAYTLRRVEDVFDCWFESGSMPYGQAHYPFENKDWFESHFPADFIVEYMAQTRGWFYTLMVLSTALFDKPPFLNCICHGVVMSDQKDENGKYHKLSKRLKNYPDPTDLFNKYGADSLRWFMMASPVMRGSELYIDAEGKFIRDVVRLAIKPVWNAYNFFCLYANADGVKAELSTGGAHIMDRYILSKLARAVQNIQTSFDQYRTPDACEEVLRFFETLNNWYIRRSKPRFWKTEKDQDKQDAYNTLYTCLHVMLRAIAPLLPLTAEEMYLGLVNGGKQESKASVHLAEFPQLNAELVNAELETVMDQAQNICNAALAIRNAQNLRVRLPLARLTVVVRDMAISERMAAIIADEVNVKEVSFVNNFDDYATLKLQVNFPVLGKRLPALMKQIIPAAKKGEWKPLPGGKVEIAGAALEPEEFSLVLEAKPAFSASAQALPDNSALVVLDTAITPDLEQEGLARDILRAIQQARKDAGLDVSDHITLTLNGHAAAKAAVEAHRSYIEEQTLSTIQWGVGEGEFTVETLIEEQALTIGISKRK